MNKKTMFGFEKKNWSCLERKKVCFWKSFENVSNGTMVWRDFVSARKHYRKAKFGGKMLKVFVAINAKWE